MAITCCTCLVNAQQLPQYSQWSQQLFIVNPAVTGIKGSIEINALFRAQWLGFEGAPLSSAFGFHGPVRAKAGSYLAAQHGWGIRFETDKLATFSTNRANLNYAIHLHASEVNKISFGINAGLIQTGYEPSLASTVDPDPTVMRSSVFVLPDMNAGLLLTSKTYFAGLSIQNLLGGTWKNIGNASSYNAHLMIQNGFKFKINDDLHILPQLALRTDFHAPLNFQLQAHADYRTILRGGIGYRTGDALIAFFTWKINPRFSLNYSFDYGVSSLYTKNLFSHEICIRFNAGKLELIKVNTCTLFD